jgi:hypothetical protein
MALLLLRLEAPRFRVAEYAEPITLRDLPARLVWYAIGLALLGALSAVHPAPHDVLDLLAGHAADVVAYGALLAAGGLAVAAGLAWLRYGYMRLAAPEEYPGAALNSIATAVIDEATFRGVLLGTLLGHRAAGRLVRSCCHDRLHAGDQTRLRPAATTRCRRWRSA